MSPFLPSFSDAQGFPPPHHVVLHHYLLTHFLPPLDCEVRLQPSPVPFPGAGNACRGFIESSSQRVGKALRVHWSQVPPNAGVPPDSLTSAGRELTTSSKTSSWCLSRVAFTLLSLTLHGRPLLFLGSQHFTLCGITVYLSVSLPQLRGP